MVTEIQAGSRDAVEELHKTFFNGLKHYFAKHLGHSEFEENAQVTIMHLVRAIQEGRIENPERLASYARGIALNVLRGEIKDRITRRNREVDPEFCKIRDHRIAPEEHMLRAEKTAIMQQALSQLSDKQREILSRFYLKEETAGQICREMRLTDTQFRLAKSRAKQLLTDRCQRLISRKPMRRVIEIHTVAKTA